MKNRIDFIKEIIKPLVALFVTCTIIFVLFIGYGLRLVKQAEQDKLEPIPTPESTPVVLATYSPEPTTAPALYTQEDVELIGRTIWGEAGGVKSKAERAAVAWCILNRVDERGQTIEQVVTAPNQFHGYRTWGECPQAHLDLAADVLTRWSLEKNGAEDVGRTLPAEYLYFYGDGKRNHFTHEWQSRDYWDWSLTNPYKN